MHLTVHLLVRVHSLLGGALAVKGALDIALAVRGALDSALAVKGALAVRGCT